MKQTLFKTTIYALCLSTMTLEANVDLHRMLFLLHRGETAEALELYQVSTQGQQHDHEAIERLCLLILEQGTNHSDPEIQLTTIFGAGISANEKAIALIEESIDSPIPQIQLAALGLLARAQQTDDAYLKSALRSPFLLIRLEALFHMAEAKHPKTATYAESLMAVLDNELWPIFPEIFVEAGDGASTRMLKRLISHHQDTVRVSTILSLAKHQRDDFLPKIRILATHHSPLQLEACAFAFGCLKDDSSIPRLKELATSHHENVKLAALTSLVRLGNKEAQKEIETMAAQEDLFAIAALDSMPGTEESLAVLATSSNPHIRLNAGLGLLAKKDFRCLPILAEILLRDSRDYAFTKTHTKGRSSTAWKVVPCAQQKEEDIPALKEQTLALKGLVLAKTLELEEGAFLQIANRILGSKQNDLVPILMVLLENKQTAGCVHLLKAYQQKAGAPLIRQYCNLTLFKLKEPGPYENLIKEWITTNMSQALFLLKAPEKDLARENGSTSHLTPDETSKLLIDSIEALARTQSKLSIDLLIESIKQGNPKNRYALAGLLLRVIQ